MQVRSFCSFIGRKYLCGSPYRALRFVLLHKQYTTKMLITVAVPRLSYPFAPTLQRQNGDHHE